MTPAAPSGVDAKAAGADGERHGGEWSRVNLRWTRDCGCGLQLAWAVNGSEDNGTGQVMVGMIFQPKEEGIAITSQTTLSELKREIEIQRTLDHPNICKVFESYEDKGAGEMYIIMEICTGGSLVSRMKTHRHGYGERAAARDVLVTWFKSSKWIDESLRTCSHVATSGGRSSARRASSAVHK